MLVVVFFVYLALVVFAFSFFGVSVFFNVMTLVNDLMVFLVNFSGCFFVEISMLIVCGVMSLCFCGHYFGRVEPIWNIILGFAIVMGLLMFSGNLLFSLVMWEYLGIVSFVLILYYRNFVSLQAPVVTMVVSRLGDVCFFFCVWLLFEILLFWWFCSLFEVIFYSLFYEFYFSFYILVNSSNASSYALVAAGVWFMSCYDFFFCSSYYISFVLVLLSFFNIVLTGLCSLGFVDLKKLVALSTSNNISWCVLFFLYGDVYLCLLQLFSHGISKCCLFIMVGDLMSSGGGTQLYNNLYIYKSLIEICGLFFVVVGLAGVPFIGVFFTKHLFLLDVCFLDMFFFGCSLLGLFLSYIYSFRMFFMILSVGLQSGFVFSYDFQFINVFFVIPFYSLLSFCLSNNFLELGFLNIWFSVIILLVFFLGVCFGYYLYVCGGLTSWWVCSIFGLDVLVYIVSKVFRFLCFLGILFHWRWDYWFICGIYSFFNSLIGLYGFILSLCLMMLLVLVFLS
uniref:NADH:ubiquinone reductase (H(+)-translocating) n=1 Tax=Diplorchis hangzhouensis TaxID=1131906 RepID=A0A3G0WZB8_9PLAT|nr:NADH dehydrogenase subunit 5 [Diplorchis hangzhouensis]